MIKITLEEPSIFPSEIENINFHYIKVENHYVIGVILERFPENAGFLEIMESIPRNIEMVMSVYIDKQDNMQMIKKLTNTISSTGGEMKTVSKNQMDIEMIGRMKQDAKALRREIQINGEEIFFTTMIFVLWDTELALLEDKVQHFQSSLYTKGCMTTKANFRQLDTYRCILPFHLQEESIIKRNQRTIITSGLSNMFPFYQKTVFDPNGILVGITVSENRLCHIDIFEDRYLNANMCIFGSSGAGKSYFLKLFILRHYIKGKRQYVLDIEGEYVTLAKKLDIGYLSICDSSPKYYWNPFEITKREFLQNEDEVLTLKQQSLTHLLCELGGWETEKEKTLLQEAIQQIYETKGMKTKKDLLVLLSDQRITFEPILKDATCFPTMIDLLNMIKNKKMKLKLEEICQRYPTFCHPTNFAMDRLLILNTQGLEKKELACITTYILQNIMDSLQLIQEETILYIDEIWKYLATQTKEGLPKIIMECYKRIRKKKASIITVTQDISDFFLYENGSYGKSILNNSGFQLFFKLVYQDQEILRQLNQMKESVFQHITKLDKGQVYVAFGNNQVTLQVKASDYETQLIEEERDEDYRSIR